MPVHIHREPAWLLRRTPLRLPGGNGARDNVRLRAVHTADPYGRSRQGGRMTDSVVFQPLEFRHLTVKNRVMRSSLAGRFNNYDGTGTRIHINWDLKFA